jgi:hypothetical protein
VISDVIDAPNVCAAVVNVLGSTVETARIDAYSDYTEQMPDDIRAAQAWLRDRGLRRDDRDPGESISIHRNEDVGWSIAQAYALWSTRVTLHDSVGAILASLDDGARAITAELTDYQLDALREQIADRATITPVSASGNR